MISQPQPPVLSQLPQFDWDPDQAVCYEVAHEAIGQVIAAYTVLIRQATTTEETAQLTRLRATCSQTRDTLHPADVAAAKQVTRDNRQLAAALRALVR